jgi:hypothetical protein
MEKLGTIELINGLQAVLRSQVERLEELRSLDESTLTRRPAQGRWSIAEIAEHMNLTSGHYYKRMRKVYRDPRSKLRYMEHFEPGRFGEISVKAMRPGPDGKINWKMKTLGMFEPRMGPAKGMRALEELRSMLEGLVELLELARVRGLEGERITSTLGPILRFKAGDAFRFPIAHQQRHFLQMDRTLEVVTAMMGQPHA